MSKGLRISPMNKVAFSRHVRPLLSAPYNLMPFALYRRTKAGKSLYALWRGKELLKVGTKPVLKEFARHYELRPGIGKRNPRRNGRSYARKGVSIGVPRHGFTPKVGDKFYVSGKLVTIKRKDGDGMLWFNRDVDGTVAMSESNLYQAAYVPEDSPFAPYEYRIKKNPTPVRVKVGKRVYNGKARRVGGRVKIYLPPNAVAKLNPDRKWTIAEIRAANRAAGYHFFDAKTMKFFGTKVLPGVSSGPNGIYFVTSEMYGHGPRTYKVRSFDPSSSQIRSVGDHNNAEDAKADARSSAKA